MSILRMPDILAHGRWRSGDELDAIARGWLAVVRDTLDDSGRPIAVALPTTQEGVALLVALSSLPSPVILLPPDVRAWRTEPAIPLGTPVVLLPTPGALGAGRPQARSASCRAARSVDARGRATDRSVQRGRRRAVHIGLRGVAEARVLPHGRAARLGAEPRSCDGPRARRGRRHGSVAGLRPGLQPSPHRDRPRRTARLARSS